MLLIVPLDIEEKYTKSEYFYDFQGTQINIVLRSIEKLRSIAKGSPDPFQREIFRNAVLIYQKDAEVMELLEKINTTQE